MKAIFILALCLFCGCNKDYKRDGESEAAQLPNQKSDSTIVASDSIGGIRRDSGANFSLDLNKVFDKNYQSENLGVKLMHSYKFKVDSNLNYYLPITLINTTNSSIVGVSLRRDEKDVIGYYKLGKYKIRIKSHASVSLKLSLSTLKFKEDILEKPWAVGPIVVDEVYYADGTYSSDKITYNTD